MTYTDFSHYWLLSLCIGHPPLTGNFYAQRASDADGLWFFLLACIVFWTNDRVSESIQFSTSVTISLTVSNIFSNFVIFRPSVVKNNVNFELHVLYNPWELSLLNKRLLVLIFRWKSTCFYWNLYIQKRITHKCY